MNQTSIRSRARNAVRTGFFLLLLVCLSAFGALDAIYAVKRLVRISQDDATSVSTKGTVMSAERMGLRSATFSRGEKRYRVHYRFLTAEGKEFEGTDAIITRQRFDPGDELQIFYRRLDPAINRVRMKNDTGDAIFHAVVGGAFVAVGVLGLVILSFAMLSLRRAARLLKEAGFVERDATIIDIKRNDAQAIVYFSFDDGHGEVRQAEDELPAEEVEKLKVGDKGKIFWNPRDPNEAQWIG